MEELVAQAFGRILYVEVFDQESDPGDTSPRVKWYGRAQGWRKAPAGPDAVAHAHGFHIVIEATQRSGAAQWQQEFAQCCRHAQDAAKCFRAKPADILTVLAAKPIHEDTFRTIRTWNDGNPFKVVALEPEVLAVAAETCGMAATVTHRQVRRLLTDLLDEMGTVHGCARFRGRMCEVTERWQSRVLDIEKAPMVAARAYRVMIRRRGVVGASSLYRSLRRDGTVTSYLEQARKTLDPDLIARSLQSEGLAIVVTRVDGDTILAPVPLEDFKSRCKRRLRAVEAAHADQ